MCLARLTRLLHRRVRVYYSVKFVWTKVFNDVVTFNQDHCSESNIKKYAFFIIRPGPSNNVVRLKLWLRDKCRLAEKISWYFFLLEEHEFVPFSRVTGNGPIFNGSTAISKESALVSVYFYVCECRLYWCVQYYICYNKNKNNNNNDNGSTRRLYNITYYFAFRKLQLQYNYHMP